MRKNKGNNLDVPDVPLFYPQLAEVRYTRCTPEVLMRSRTSFFPAALSVALFVSGSARALPKLEEPVSLPPDFNGVITIYPDSDNTKETKKFWLVPSTARVVRKPDGKLEYGLVHSGISGLYKDGISAQLTVTLQPWVDDGTLQKAKKLIEATEKANGAKTVT